jgi:hypothetical protein
MRLLIGIKWLFVIVSAKSYVVFRVGAIPVGAGSAGA